MRRNSLIERQLRGAVIIVALAFILYSARWTFQYFQTSGGSSPFEFGDKKSGSLIVELSGDTDSNGIYYLPEGTKLSGLVAKAGIKNAEDLGKTGPDHTLSTGDKIVVGGSSVGIEKMDAPARLALDMPININEATVKDMVLIPGIGLKTATKIAELRKKRGGLSHINDLKRTGALGKKKFEGIKKYLIVE
ncbi:MAG: helix-hairpin-helix domain-containing protein [Thermodesulfobacteriota bacterium]|nr:helix-hairpin-helix domain-containing protein [Thermodesulfobacteriota bacterium]